METINKYFFDFIYEESLQDATRRTAANNKPDKKSDSPKELVQKSNRLKGIVKDYAEKVINGQSPIFCEYVTKFQKQLKNEHISGFTFGNIQKLINMTMKRLYLRYCKEHRDNFSCCHAPMDMKMRDVVCKKYKEKTDEKLGIEDCAWSKMEFGQSGKDDAKCYFIFQNAISKIIEEENKSFLQIEYDYVMWGKTAEEKLPETNIFIQE